MCVNLAIILIVGRTSSLRSSELRRSWAYLAERSVTADVHEHCKRSVSQTLSSSQNFRPRKSCLGKPQSIFKRRKYVVEKTKRIAYEKYGYIWFRYNRNLHRVRDRSFLTREGGLLEIGRGSPEKMSEKGWLIQTFCAGESAVMPKKLTLLFTEYIFPMELPESTSF